jgi:hypothetical protein
MILAATGTLAKRDATPEEADKALAWREAPWPAGRPEEAVSPYSARFRDGAVIFPSVLFRVEPASPGRLVSIRLLQSWRAAGPIWRSALRVMCHR